MNTLKGKKISPITIAESLSDYWSPRIIAEIDDNFVKVAKLKGSFVWHSHDFEDEMFFILKGQLEIELREETISLNVGDIYTVPAGVEHNPIAREECLVLLIEKKTTKHTGNVKHEKSKSLASQLKE